MPALVLFGRRSRVGSDDLYCPAFFLILYQVPFVLIAVLYVSFWRQCSTMSFDIHGIPWWFMLGAIPIYGFMACVYLIIMHTATKGTIIDHERRMLMPRILHVHMTWSFVMFAYGVMGLVFWYHLELCYPDERFVLTLAGAMVAEVSATFSFGFCILGGVSKYSDEDSSSPYGTVSTDSEQQALLAEMDRTIPNSDVYVPSHQKRWETRCQSLCACVRCFTCNLFGGSGTQHDSMSTVARVIARLFYGSPDLVISDIVAGFVLLAAVQAHEEAMEGDRGDTTRNYHSPEGMETLHSLRQRNSTKNPQRDTASSKAASHGHGTYNDGYTPSSQLEAEHIAISIPSTTPLSPTVHEELLGTPREYDSELVESVEELAHFSKFAVGIYGWMLYLWSHPWSGTFRLAFSCMKRTVHYVHGDNALHLGQTALQLETGVKVQDIVYASFHNSVCRPAFCVVLDHDRGEIVIAIRGTLSLEDCLTDAIAYGKSMDEIAERFGCDGHGEFAHQGFLYAAQSIYLEINRLGLLEMLFEPDSQASIAFDELKACTPGEYHDYGLVVTGHSLGAGTAVLLSVMLKPKYVNLRCFAFSPPGCTVSPGLAKRCASFVTSVVVGYDIVARSSLASIEELRDQVIDLIARSKVGKSEILRQVTAWKKPDELLYDRPVISHDETCGSGSPRQGMDQGYNDKLANYRTMLQRIQASEPIHPLVSPGRLIHFRRNVRHRHIGCWVCCRPGSGGVCCTERTDYDFAWSVSEHFEKVQIARTMLDDHFPDKVHHILQDCAKRMKPKETHCGL